MTSPTYPPGPRSPFTGLRIAGSGDDPLIFLDEMAHTWGDISHCRVGPRHVYLLNHPDLVHELLVTKERSFSKGVALQRAKDLLGEGLLTSEGEPHLMQRRFMQPAFHRQRVAAYAETMIDAAERAAALWQDGDEIDIADEMMHVTLDIVARVLFGYDVSDEASEIRQAMNDILGLFRMFVSPFGPFLRRLPIPPSQRAERALARLELTIGRIIAERRASGEDRGDLLSMLLARDENGRGITDRQIRDEVMTLFLAGHETTANALAWTWYLLARHPYVAKQLEAELQREIGSRPLVAGDYPRLRYTEMVFAESMRLYPPVWAVGRQAIEDVEIGGWTLPRGSIAAVSQWVLHRDERFWNEPHVFNPLRWTPERKSERPRYAYFPFGAGSRMCIGESFAWMEGVLVMATIARRWRFYLISDDEPRRQASITLRPRDGIRIRVQRRSREECADTRRVDPASSSRAGHCGNIVSPGF